MRKILLPLLITSFLLGCKGEDDVEPANTSTFIRYFGSQYNHTAVLAQQVGSELVLLVNVDRPHPTNIGFTNSSIKLIRTDLYGNPVGPEVMYSAPTDTENGYRASSFIPFYSGSTLEGYLIVGDRIYSDNQSELLVIKVSPTGDKIAEATFKPSDVTLSMGGRAIVQKDNNSNTVYVLGNIVGGSGDMFVGELNVSGNTITQGWSREYGSVEGNLLNRLFVKNTNKLFWAGTYKNPLETDLRICGAVENSNSDVDNMVGSGTISETAFDVEDTGNGFAIVGSTLGETGGLNIYFTKVDLQGNQIFERDVDFDGVDDEAVSICKTHNPEEGYWVLSTVKSGTSRGYGESDIYLCRLDFNGNEITSESINYGGSDNEEGASIRTVDDGYLVFATARYRSQSKVMLMKVNMKGKL